MTDQALTAYQHAIRRCLEPLTNPRHGRASPATVQRFIDRATGAAVLYAHACQAAEPLNLTRCICGPDSTGENPDCRPDCPQHGADVPYDPWASDIEEYPF